MSLYPFVGVNAESRARRRWSQEENERLLWARDVEGKEWDEISQEIAGRSESGCKNHHYVLHSAASSNGNSDLSGGTFWSEEEDSKLRDLKKSKMNKTWIDVAAGLPGRSPRACETRHRNKNDPRKFSSKGKTFWNVIDWASK